MKDPPEQAHVMPVIVLELVLLTVSVAISSADPSIVWLEDTLENVPPGTGIETVFDAGEVELDVTAST